MTLKPTNPNRMVTIFTPVFFAPLAGAISAAAAKYGLDIDGGQLQAIFIAGATIAFAKSGMWLKGWQDYEKRQQTQQADTLAAVEPDLDPAIDDEAPTQAEAAQAVAEEFDDDDFSDDDMDDDFEAEAEELLAQRG